MTEVEGGGGGVERSTPVPLCGPHFGLLQPLCVSALTLVVVAAVCVGPHFGLL